MINLFTLGQKTIKEKINGNQIKKNFLDFAKNLENQYKSDIDFATKKYNETGKVPYGYSRDVYSGKIRKLNTDELEKINNFEDKTENYNPINKEKWKKNFSAGENGSYGDILNSNTSVLNKFGMSIAKPFIDNITTGIDEKGRRKLEEGIGEKSFVLKGIDTIQQGAGKLAEDMYGWAEGVKNWGYNDGREEKIKNFMRDRLADGYSENAIIKAIDILDRQGKFRGDWTDNPISGTIGSVASGILGAGASLERGIHNVTGAMLEGEKSPNDVGLSLRNSYARGLKGATEMFGGASGLAMSVTPSGLAVNTAFSSDTLAKPMDKYVAQPMRDVTAWTQEILGMDKNSQASKDMQEVMANIGPDMIQLGAYKGATQLKPQIEKLSQKGQATYNNIKSRLSDNIGKIDIKNSIGDNKYLAKPIQTISNIKDSLAGLTKKDIEILKETTSQEFDNWVALAQKSKDSNYEFTPYNEGARQANKAIEILENNIAQNQTKRIEIIKNSNIKQIDFSGVRENVIDDFKKTFNIESFGNGELKAIEGRKAMFDTENSRDIKALEILDDAMKGGSPAEVMDTVKILQGYTYDSSTGLRVSDTMKKFLERTTGRINHEFKQVMGTKYAKILQEMSDDIKLQQEIEKIFKPTAENGASNRGELAMKRLANGTTTSGDVLNLALKIKEQTGIDLIKTARLGQLAMDIVGDDRGASLYKMIGDVQKTITKQGVIDTGLRWVGEKLVDTEKVARSYTKDSDVRYLKNGGSRTPSIEWRQGLEAFKKGKLPAHNTLEVYKPRGILKEMFGENPLTISQSRLKAKMNKHGLSFDDIKHLNIGIDKHILAYQTGGKHSVVVFITPIKKGNERIAVAINHNPKTNLPEIAEIKSIHPKDGQRLVNELFGGKIDNVYSANNKKISSWLGSVLPDGGQPTTKGGDLNSILHNFKEKSNNSVKSYINRNLDASTISQAEAKAIVKKYFKDDIVSVRLAEKIITKDGGEAIGMYHKKMITFAKNPTKYTPEHEVMHAYFDLALDNKQKNTILKAIQKEQNLKTKLDAEEWLADTFAEFVAGRRETKTMSTKMKKIIDDLVYIFKKFFGQEDKVEALMRELEGIGKGKKEMNVVNDGGYGKKFLANTSKKFDENFKKFADDKFAEIQKATEENKNFTIRHSISKKTKNFLLKEGFTELPEQQVTTANSIRHIFKEHGVGNEKNPDQIPVTWEDIKHIPEIQQNYDNIKISPYKNKQGQTVIIYEKIIDNHYYYLEKINHRGQLETQTMYIKNIKKDS